MSIEVMAPGAQTTVQDAGRLGHYHDGMAPGGPQDSYSFRIANLLVGNGLSPRLFTPGSWRGAAGLKMTMKGPTLKFHEPCVVAVTGADMHPTVDGQPIEMWKPLAIKKDAVMAFEMARAGARSYFAVSGGIDVPPVLGSRSTCLVARCGGVEGRPLKAGDLLPIGPSESDAVDPDVVALPPQYRLELVKTPVIRVVLGPQDHLFVPESVKAFREQAWTMSPVSNRMGFRFNGPELRFRDRAPEVVRDSGSDPSNIVDDVIPVGGIQIPGGKQAIIMGVEAPSVGGYAKIATVISADFGMLGQLRPGQSAHFASVSLEQAGLARNAQEQMLLQAAGVLGLPIGHEARDDL